ncbi:MAG: hypothetical protein RXR41_03510 [Candidatus Marsarchaeota archaeon]
MKSAIREYEGKNIDIKKLGQKLEEYFKEEGYKTQLAEHPQGIVIQAQKGGILRTLLAADRALTITITGDPNKVVVRMGVAKWLQNLGVAAIEGLILTPLLFFVEVPESLWSFEIERQVWNYIESLLNLGDIKIS